ncbi:MAG: tetratricopeptide repeat protein [Spirochaetaceae bacterium]|jgi:putative GTP pyrophosphokinase|nr:tetratricopeptide repeat protein [Spirochaetaceae bacterium]
MKRSLPNSAELRKQYEEDYATRLEIVKDLEEYLERELRHLPSHLTVKHRIKSFNSFYKKYLRYLKESGGKEVKIPDEIGIRIVCPFLEDVIFVEDEIKRCFEVIEIEEKGNSYSFKEFGYESHHVLVRIPRAIGEKYHKKSGGDFSDEIAEIQLRTNLQDAWAEVEHELVYKARFAPLDTTMRRKLAAINASLSLADTIFQEFRSYQRQLNNQLARRRQDFYSKIEEVADAFLPVEAIGKTAGDYTPRLANSSSIDDLLLNALYAHNKGQFRDAEMFYSQILDLEPDRKLEALVRKHRGMASFAQSNYHEAIGDFSRALELDKKSAQPAYYLGVVYSCLREYGEAIEAFSDSIKIDPFQKYCFFRRAQCYYHLSDYPSALSDCESALSLDAEFDAVKKFKPMLLDKLKM